MALLPPERPRCDDDSPWIKFSRLFSLVESQSRRLSGRTALRADLFTNVCQEFACLRSVFRMETVQWLLGFVKVGPDFLCSCRRDPEWLAGVYRQLYRRCSEPLEHMVPVDRTAWACARETVHIYGARTRISRLQVRLPMPCIVLFLFSRHRIVLFLAYFPSKGKRG
jgi:hypothetical protein